MALVIKHTKVSAIPDGTDPSVIRPSDWNADHALSGVATIAQGGTGQSTANAAVNALLPAQTGQAGKVLGTDGTNTSWVDKGASGGVTQIIAGTNVTISPVEGTGTVTINAAGSGSIIGQTQNVSPFETAIGFEAGNANTGVNNTYMGYQAGRAVTGGTNNVAIGYQALDVATIPAGNVVIGSGACGATTGSSQNVVIGFGAAGATTLIGSDCVIIGNDAGRTVTGTSNILIGSSCGNNVTTGTQMVGIGTGCFGTATAAAAGSVAIGNNALGGLTSGARNTAVGGQSGAALLTGNDNTFLGFDTGKLVTGNENTFIGSLAGDAVTSGALNTFVGAGAGGIATTGSGNTFIGRLSGNVVTTGGNNTIIGNYAGSSATMAGFVILADGAGNQRIVTNGTGALSFDGTDFGAIGFVLQTNGNAARPTWVNKNISSVATFATNVSGLPNISVYFMDCTSGNLTFTLPSASANTGLKMTVKRTDQSANTLTVASVSGLIEGLATQSLGVSVAVQYCSDGTNWWELANS